MRFCTYPLRILKILIYMATLKLTVFKAKVLKDGRHKIRIAVCHKHETSYIITNFIIDSESQFKNGQVVKRPDASMMNSKLRNLLNEYQEKLDAIKNKEIYSCIQIKNIITKSQSEDESTTFQQVCMAYENELVEKGSSGYAGLLRQNRKYFTEYVHGDILLCDITPEIIEGYSAFLRKNKKLEETTNGMMMRHTKTIINRGIKKRMVKYEVHPYIDFSIPSSPVRDIDISVETFNAIRKSSPQEKRLRIARDLFCLSFYLGGINLIDLMSYDFRKSEKIEYVRTKSRNRTVGTKVISFTIPEPAMAIIRTWINKTTGKLDFGYKFTYKNFQRYISRSLAALVKSIGISEKVMFYSARKSFAQYASEIGIPDGIIDYCLGHSDKSKGVYQSPAKTG